MSNRLNQEREKKLQPQRLEFAKQEIEKLGLTIVAIEETRIDFIFKNHKIQYYPYSGWATGKSIKDCRGLKNLLPQLKANSPITK